MVAAALTDNGSFITTLPIVLGAFLTDGAALVAGPVDVLVFLCVLPIDTAGPVSLTFIPVGPVLIDGLGITGGTLF